MANKLYNKASMALLYNGKAEDMFLLFKEQWLKSTSKNRNKKKLARAVEYANCTFAEG